jgi:hypothetical protein
VTRLATIASAIVARRAVRREVGAVIGCMLCFFQKVLSSKSHPAGMSLARQLVFLVVLAIPIACISWTVTHEEVFREPREWFVRKSRHARRLASRKFFYLVTCEYCFSHYVTVFILILTRYRLLYDDARGYLIAGFSLVWVANAYMSLFGRLRLEIRENQVEIATAEARRRRETDRGPR